MFNILATLKSANTITEYMNIAIIGATFILLLLIVNVAVKNRK